MPTITECQGSVPKKGPDKFRAIADAREGNKSLDDWGVRYFTWQDFSHASRHHFGATRSRLAPSFWGTICRMGTTSRSWGELVWGWGVVGLKWVYPSQTEYLDSDAESDPAAPQQQFKFGMWDAGQGIAARLVTRHTLGCIWTAAWLGGRSRTLPEAGRVTSQLLHVVPVATPGDAGGGPGRAEGGREEDDAGVVWADDLPCTGRSSCLSLVGGW